MLYDTATEEETEFEEKDLEDHIYNVSNFSGPNRSESLASLYPSELYKDPLISWDSECDYW
ncbi:33896_t:CDS:1, partial [Gigaspora margarita]